MRKFLPPADLDDFTPKLRDKWHRQMNGWFNTAVKAVEGGGDGVDPIGVGPGKSQFYNAALVTAAHETAIPIVWSGFPRALRTSYGRRTAFAVAEQLVRWGSTDPLYSPIDPQNEGAIVDSSGSELDLYYRPQDEYLEWHTVRNPRSGEIVRITFTCEARDYWESLARWDFSKVVELYRRYIDPAVRPADLCFDRAVRTSDGQIGKGQYNPWNAWNTKFGAMHLTHPANTLGAEITLAAAGTILRRCGQGGYLSESARLICCSRYGGENRSSDPQIGSSVNRLTQLGGKVSLQIPVALYIDQVDENCVTDSDGKPVPSFWRLERGQAGIPGSAPSRILRLVYEVPPGHRRYNFSNLYVDGEILTSGSQLATHVHMKLIGTHIPGGPPNQPRGCVARAWWLRSNTGYLVSAPLSPGSKYEPAFPFDRSTRLDSSAHSNRQLQSLPTRRRRS